MRIRTKEPRLTPLCCPTVVMPYLFSFLLPRLGWWRTFHWTSHTWQVSMVCISWYFLFLSCVLRGIMHLSRKNEGHVPLASPWFLDLYRLVRSMYHWLVAVFLTSGRAPIGQEGPFIRGPMSVWVSTFFSQSMPNHWEPSLCSFGRLNFGLEHLQQGEALLALSARRRIGSMKEH